MTSNCLTDREWKIDTANPATCISTKEWHDFRSYLLRVRAIWRIYNTMIIADSGIGFDPQVLENFYVICAPVWPSWKHGQCV